MPRFAPRRFRKAPYLREGVLQAWPHELRLVFAGREPMVCKSPPSHLCERKVQPHHR